MSEENPYHSPNSTQHSLGQMPPGKPTAIKVFGILHLIFGAMGILGLLLSSVMLFATGPQNQGMPNPALEMMNANATYKIFMMVTLGLGLIFTVVLIFAGVGLLQSRKYGRSLSNWYAIYAILSAIIGAVVNYIFLIAPMLEQAPQGGPAAAGAVGGAIGGLAGGCFGTIYPILVLIFINKQNVKDALH